MTSEGKLVASVNRYCKDNGWFQVNLIQTNVNGIPDRLIYKDGRYIWLELKADDGKPSPIQTHRISSMKSKGMEVHVIYSLNELKEIIDENS